MTDERLERARSRYEQAIFADDIDGLAAADRDLDGVEADLALARGRIIHARFVADRQEDPHELALFERAAQLYAALDDIRGEAESLFWIGCFHQVVRADNDTAVPQLRRSADLAAQAGDGLTRSYALRHLGIAEHVAGRTGVARGYLEESVQLRRDLGFRPGVAANLVGLAYIARAEDRPDDAAALLDEAGALADATGAAGIARQVAEARSIMPS